MSESVKRVNVTLPMPDVERIGRLVSTTSDYLSVSAFVAAAVREKLAESDAQDMLHRTLVDCTGEPTAEDRAWAEEAIRTAHEVAAAPDPAGTDDGMHRVRGAA